MKRHVALGAAITLALSAGTALATPGSGVTAVDLARGTSAAAYTITAAANMDVATQTNTFGPGATSGWHSHPGAVVSIVKSGTLSLWFSSDCTLRTLTAGQAIVVPGGAGLYDLGQNQDATVPLVVVQTFYDVPVGGPLRTNAPGPQCSLASPSVPQDMVAAGVTGVLHTRVRVASAINITGAANTDLYIQQVTVAPGGTTGWHRHLGQHTVLVDSGTLTYVRADCTTSLFPSGTGFVDAGDIHMARNDGTTPTNWFLTYTNLPVASAARIDAAAPTCAAPAASPLPNAAMPTGRGPTSPMPLVPVLFVLGLAGLLALGRSRARHR